MILQDLRMFLQEQQQTCYLYLAILVWLYGRGCQPNGSANPHLNCYRLMLETGMDAPPRVTAAVDAYRQEADIIGSFLAEYTSAQEGGRLSTSLLYSYYAEWAKTNGYRPLSNRPFVGDLRRRYEIKPDCKKGNVIIGLALSREANPYADDTGEKLPWD